MYRQLSTKQFLGGTLMKLKLLKGLTLALALTLVGTAVVPVNAADTNGNVIDEEMLDSEMDMDEDCGSLELDTGLADIDNESEDSGEALEGFNELFPEALTSENDPVNTVYDNYSLQTGSENDRTITEVSTEEVTNQSEMDEMLENMEEVGSYSEDLGNGLVMEVTEYVKEHPSLSRANVNKVDKYNGSTSRCINVNNYYHRSTNTYRVSYSAQKSGNSAYGVCILRNAKTGKVASHKNFKLWVTASGKVYKKVY